MARSRQPGLIIVDRTVTGKYENYRTPEQEVPEKPLRSHLAIFSMNDTGRKFDGNVLFGFA